MLTLSTKDRREFLKKVCQAGLLIPFASQFLPGKRVNAQGSAAKRLIMIYYPNGAVLEAWHPKSMGRIRKGSTLSYAMDPLSEFADRLIPLRNMTTKGHGGSSSHPEAASQILSGGYKGTPSIDVAIANNLNRQGTLDYLHVGLFNRYNNGKEYLLFRDSNGQSILPEDDPAKVAKQLFGSTGRGDPKEQERNLKILEVIGDDLAKLRRIDLNSQTVEKLDTHEQSLSHLESLIRSSFSSSCGPITSISMGSNRRENNLKGEEITLSQFDNIVSAFKCDITSVASFQFMAAQDESLYINFDSVQAELDQADGGGFGSTRRWWNQNLSHPSSHEANQVFRVQNRWYNMMVAELCRKLDRVQDPLGGGSLLDNTLICVFSEDGQSANHGLEDVGWYLVGGGSGFFDMGKVVDVRGRGSSDLFLELARAMGLSWSKFGNSSTGIPGLY